MGGGKIMLDSIIFKLIIPTIIFASINYVPKIVLRGNAFDVKSCLMDTLGGCSLWFTCSLAISELLFLILFSTRINKLSLFFVFSVICATIGVLVDKSGFNLLGSDDFPWYYKNALLAMLYMAFGGIYMKYENKIDKCCNLYLLSLLLIVYLGIEFVIPEKALCLTSMEQMNCLGVVVSIIGSYLLIRLCKILPQLWFFTFVGRKSICFYFFSGALPITLSTIMGHYIDKSTIYCMGTVFLISSLFGLFITYFLTKYFPFLFDLRLLKKKQYV